MTFKQILKRANFEIKEHYLSGFDVNPLKLVLDKKELSTLKRQFAKYKKECQNLMDYNNFDMSEIDDYNMICDYIKHNLDTALVL